MMGACQDDSDHIEQSSTFNTLRSSSSYYPGLSEAVLEDVNNIH